MLCYGLMWPCPWLAVRGCTQVPAKAQGKGLCLQGTGHRGNSMPMVDPLHGSSSRTRRTLNEAPSLKCVPVKVITLARKPLEGTVADSVLTYGCGALNIDACRTDFTSVEDVEETTGKNQHAKFGSKPLTNNVIYGDYSMVAPKNYTPSGRWPSNLILLHMPECNMTGMTPTEGYTINRWSDGAKPFGGGAGHPYEGSGVAGGYMIRWDCAVGCPVVHLDQPFEGLDLKPSRYFKQVSTCSST